MLMGLLFSLGVIAFELVVFRLTRALAARAVGVRGVSIVRRAAAADFDNALGAARPLIWIACGFAAYASVVALFVVASLLRGEPGFDGRVALVADKPAAMAGLRESDRIIAIDGSPIGDFEDIHRIVGPVGNRPVDVEIRRDGQPLHLQVSPTEGKIGVMYVPGQPRPMPVGRALVSGATRPFLVVSNVAKAVVELVHPTSSGKLAGSVAMVKEMKRTSDNGWAEMFELAGVLSTYYGLPLMFILAYVSLPSRAAPKVQA